MPKKTKSEKYKMYLAILLLVNTILLVLSKAVSVMMAQATGPILVVCIPVFIFTFKGSKAARVGYYILSCIALFFAILYIAVMFKSGEEYWRFYFVFGCYIALAISHVLTCVFLLVYHPQK